MMERGMEKSGRVNVWSDVLDGRGARWSRPTPTTSRLYGLHAMYERLGSLGAVGKEVGLTRERVRQLLVKGTQRGLFSYNPRRYPVVPKEQIIEAYTRIQSISRVARLNRVSENHLKKLLVEYAIEKPQLARYRLEGRRARCRAEYLQMVEQAGRHLSSGDLHRYQAGLALYARIIRCWGSIHAFRRALKIPAPPKPVRRLPDQDKACAMDVRPLSQPTRSASLSLEAPVG